jgi:uncharacterized membrane protein
MDVGGITVVIIVGVILIVIGIIGRIKSKDKGKGKSR